MGAFFLFSLVLFLVVVVVERAWLGFQFTLRVVFSCDVYANIMTMVTTFSAQWGCNEGMFLLWSHSSCHCCLRIVAAMGAVLWQFFCA